MPSSSTGWKHEAYSISHMKHYIAKTLRITSCPKQNQLGTEGLLTYKHCRITEAGKDLWALPVPNSSLRTAGSIHMSSVWGLAILPPSWQPILVYTNCEGLPPLSRLCSEKQHLKPSFHCLVQAVPEQTSQQWRSTLRTALSSNRVPAFLHAEYFTLCVCHR